MSSILKLLISVLLAASFTSASLNTEYSNSAFLDEAKTYKLYWKIDDDKKIISFAVEVETLGWVGFGISPGNGNMVGSDVVIGWVKGNKGYLKDRYAESRTLPVIDEKQDYNLTEAYEENKKTVLKFSRKYDTCDKQDIKIEQGTVRVIYSYHPQDPVSEETIPMHTVRGTRSLFLRSILTKKPALPNDLKEFDLRVDINVSSKETLYYCKPFQIPDFNDTKKHVVKISPIITPGNEGMVHHILVYGCKDDFPVSNLSGEGECYTSDMPDHVNYCAGQAVVAAWAIGGDDFYFPSHVGFPLGDELSVKFVVMEIHYDNPDKLRDRTDQSGLRFHYTSSLRKYDADMLWVGWDVSHFMWIPPYEKKWNSIGYCPSSCTKIGLSNSSLPEGGIKVFAAILHSHLLGSAIWTKHIRNGKELPEIARDDHYDFNFQDFQILEKERHILPGDEMITTCQYDSSNRTKLTMGGLSTKEEMCLSYMYYYPRNNFTTCVSKVYGSYQFARDYQKRTNTTVEDWGKIDWKKEWNEDLNEAYDNQTHTRVGCERSKGIRIKLKNNGIVPIPSIKEPLPKPNDCSVGPTVPGTEPGGTKPGGTKGTEPGVESSSVKLGVTVYMLLTAVFLIHIV